MDKEIIPTQLNLHFEEVRDSAGDPNTSDPIFAHSTSFSSIAAKKGTIVNFERFIENRKKSDNDSIYQQILDSVRLI